MQLEDIHKIEPWLAGLLAAIAFIWKGVRMLFKMQNIIDGHTQKISKLDSDTTKRFDRLDTALKNVAASAEHRYDKIDAKLDRLIERQLSTFPSWD